MLFWTDGGPSRESFIMSGDLRAKPAAQLGFSLRADREQKVIEPDGADSISSVTRLGLSGIVESALRCLIC